MIALTALGAGTKINVWLSRIFPRVAAHKTRLTLGCGTGFQPVKHTTTKRCVHRLAKSAQPYDCHTFVMCTLLPIPKVLKQL